jgi:tellurite methyltransferase
MADVWVAALLAYFDMSRKNPGARWCRLSAIASVIDLALQKTRARGYHIVATFNDGPHDLSAHPGFTPTLASHDFYLKRYFGNEILSESSHVIHETHPHNGVPHFHSLTRLIARKAK